MLRPPFFPHYHSIVSDGLLVMSQVTARHHKIEMVSVPLWFLEVSGVKDNRLADWMASRLDQLELTEREWLAADRFTSADLLMADVLRVSKVRAFGDQPATETYVSRVTNRPAFKKVLADQLAHFAAADASRSAAG